MRKTNAIIFCGAMLASTAQLTGVTLAAEKGSEKGVIAIIKPGDKAIGDPNIKPGETGTLPYIEKRKSGTKLNPRMQNPPHPDKGVIGDPNTKPGKTRGVWNPGDKDDPGIGDPSIMPAWAREAFENKGGGEVVVGEVAASVPHATGHFCRLVPAYHAAPASSIPV